MAGNEPMKSTFERGGLVWDKHGLGATYNWAKLLLAVRF